MRNPLKRIGLILVLLFLFPAVFFTAIEINALNESERVLENIYENQLETILLSINRFSEDVLSDWTNGLESQIALNPNKSLKDISKDFLQNKSSLENLFYADTTFANLTFLTANNVNKDSIKAILVNNKSKVNRLENYLKGGYRKLEPLNGNDENLVVFILNKMKNENLFGYEINADRFINEVLSPKIQEVAKDDIVIKCLRTSDNNIVYSTDNSFDQKEVTAKKTFWLFPNYEVGITLKGDSLEEIVKSRSYFNLSLLGGLNLLLIIAVIFLYRSIKKEIHLAQLKSEFVSNVSHELRTPLALISMFAETLEMGRVRTDEKKNEYYSIISQEAQRLSKIVNSILNFSKMESGKRKYNLESRNLNEIVNKVLNSYDFHLKSKGFEVEINLNENLDEINADEEAVSECIINLLDNGMKYSRDEKRLVVSTNQKDDFVCFSVKDYGIGISKEDQKKVFEKFYRVPSNLVHNTKGTGLGLSLVFQILEAHNGKVDLISEPEKGSTFTLCFPTEKN